MAQAEAPSTRMRLRLATHFTAAGASSIVTTRDPSSGAAVSTSGAYTPERSEFSASVASRCILNQTGTPKGRIRDPSKP